MVSAKIHRRLASAEDLQHKVTSRMLLDTCTVLIKWCSKSGLVFEYQETPCPVCLKGHQTSYQGSRMHRGGMSGHGHQQMQMHSINLDFLVR
jgi:hypothetical protein